MRFYLTARGSWAATQDEARRLAKEDGSHGSFGLYEVPTDSKPAMLAWLRDQQYRPAVIHSDEGGASQPTPFVSSAVETPSAAIDDLAFRNQLAERWDSLPLPFCLDLAALALERARTLADPERTH